MQLWENPVLGATVLAAFVLPGVRYALRRRKNMVTNAAATRIAPQPGTSHSSPPRKLARPLDAWLLTATPNACAGRGECVRAHCGCVRIVRIVAGLLLMVGSVLCV